MRFTIAALLVGIMILALGLAALRTPNPLSASLAFSASLTFLTIALLAAIYRSEGRRAFWVGTSVCGWLYLMLNFAPWFEHRVSPALATTAALDYLFPLVVDAPAPGASNPVLAYSEKGVGTWLSTNITDPSPYWLDNNLNTTINGFYDIYMITSPARFRRIGHSLFTLLFACLGGMIARGLYATRFRPSRDRRTA